MRAACQCSNSIVYIKKPRRTPSEKKKKKTTTEKESCGAFALLSLRHSSGIRSSRRLYGARCQKPPPSSSSRVLRSGQEVRDMRVCEKLLRVREPRRLQAISCRRGMQRVKPGKRLVTVRAGSRLRSHRIRNTQHNFHTSGVCV